jgi:hypothetical protein
MPRDAPDSRTGDHAALEFAKRIAHLIKDGCACRSWSIAVANAGFFLSAELPAK